MTGGANLVNRENYGIYKELVDKGKITINAKDFSYENINDHYNWIVNILRDGIETEYVQGMMIHLIFTDGESVEFTILDYMFNLIFYPIILSTGQDIDSTKIFWCQDITSKNIEWYINNLYIRPYITKIDQIVMNQTIDSIFTKFIQLSDFQYYLANTINLEDTIDLMNTYEDFNASIHCDASGIPIEDVKEYGMKSAYVQIDRIKNSDHCLRDSFRTGEAISPKQFKEVYVNIGTKPNGSGGVYPTIINRSLINCGLTDIEDNVIESSIGRIAQNLTKNNVGTSGNFARILGLNCQNTRLHYDPNYSCDTKNFIEVTIVDEDYLYEFDMRWYRIKKDGVDKLINADRDKHLIGQTIYLRSPMTCNSFTHGQGVCYKCYGTLAYVNNNMNIGKYAAENQSSKFTQKLLSAKHLLESNIKAMEWRGPIFDFLAIDYDNLCLREDVDYTDCMIRLNNIDTEDEYDDVDYNYYVTSFSIIYPDGHMEDSYTTDSDNIYLQPDVAVIANKILDNSDEDYVDLSLADLYKTNHLIVFKIRIKNDEIQATMNRIRNIINVKSETSKYNKDTFLKEFMDTNLKGGVKIRAVHYEVILANQMRDGENELEFPDWGVPDQTNYQIVTLNNSLIRSPFLMTRLLYSKPHKVLIDPTTYMINKPSDNDMFAMPNPMEFIHKTEDIHTGQRNSLINDDEENIVKKINPIVEWNSPEEYYKWAAEKYNVTKY